MRLDVEIALMMRLDVETHDHASKFRQVIEVL